MDLIINWRQGWTYQTYSTIGVLVKEIYWPIFLNESSPQRPEDSKLIDWCDREIVDRLSLLYEQSQIVYFSPSIGPETFGSC